MALHHQEPSVSTDLETDAAVSEHAVLRYRQRVDTREAFPKEALRDLYDSATPVRRDGVDGAAYLADGVLLVVQHGRRDTIVTCWTDGGAGR